MILILGYLFCLYLVIKGVEVYVTALTADPEKKTAGRTIALLLLVVCVVLAVVFILWLTLQASSAKDIPSGIFG